MDNPKLKYLAIIKNTHLIILFLVQVYGVMIHKELEQTINHH